MILPSLECMQRNKNNCLIKFNLNICLIMPLQFTLIELNDHLRDSIVGFSGEGKFWIFYVLPMWGETIT